MSIPLSSESGPYYSGANDPSIPDDDVEDTEENLDNIFGGTDEASAMEEESDYWGEESKVTDKFGGEKAR